jgi:transposase
MTSFMENLDNPLPAPSTSINHKSIKMAPISAKQQWSPHKRTRVVTMASCARSYREIAAKTGVTRGSIAGIIKRYKVQTSAQNNPRISRPQHPHSITDRDLRHINMIITRDPFILLDNLREEAGLRCCTRTLSRKLKQQNIMHQRALQRPLLSEIIAQKRLAFAQRWLSEPKAIFQKWIFSDEVTIEKNDGERQGWIFRRIAVSC